MMLLCALIVSIVSAIGCGIEPALQDETWGVHQKSVTVNGLQASYRQIYLRGTHNQWKTTPMTLVADHSWEGEASFNEGPRERFKFDVYGNWSLNFGDDNRDGIADRSGRDIAVEGGKTYIINFNDRSRSYYVQEKTYSVTVTYKIPAGVSPSSFFQKQAMLYQNNQQQGWYIIYVDTTPQGSVVYSPMSLRQGSYVLKLEQMIDNKRYIGELEFTIDGSKQEIDLNMSVTVGNTTNFGSIEVSVFADQFSNGQLQSAPFNDIGVFLGDWQAGHRLCHTDHTGKCTAQLQAGTHLLSVFKMTSSHSIASSRGHQVEVVANQSTAPAIHLAPVTVRISAYYDAGMGQALYVTGASSYLGNWQTAIKMTYDPNAKAWILERNLPLHAPFKIVKAKWSDDEQISCSSVQWEKGHNRTIPAPQGYYKSIVNAYPQF
jgi:hypothetical protein